MVRYQGELDQDRKTILPRLKRKEQREAKQAKRSGNIQPKSFESLSTRERAWKGKTKFDFNNFVYMCDHLLRKENREKLELEILHRSDIFRWISQFLTERGYKKKKVKHYTPYTPNNIRKLINLYEDKKTSEMELFKGLVNEMFESFCNPQKRLSIKPLPPTYVVKRISFQSTMDWDSFVKDKPPI